MRTPQYISKYMEENAFSSMNMRMTQELIRMYMDTSDEQRRVEITHVVYKLNARLAFSIIKKYKEFDLTEAMDLLYTAIHRAMANYEEKYLDYPPGPYFKWYVEATVEEQLRRTKVLANQSKEYDFDIVEAHVDEYEEDSKFYKKQLDELIELGKNQTTDQRMRSYIELLAHSVHYTNTELTENSKINTDRVSRERLRQRLARARMYLRKVAVKEKIR